MISIFLLVLTALLFPGIILRVKSLAAGRKGPGIFQPWKNIWVLLHKSSVISITTSYIFRFAPLVYLATILTSMTLVPFTGFSSPFGFQGDFILFAYLLGLGKFFFIIGALDTGSSFEGMGANREALYSMLVEPAFFILIGTLGMITGYSSMQDIFTMFQFSGHNAFIIGIIAIYLLVQVAMVENSRMPVDDPKTHLELTMIHEVMILDHSGFDLAMIHIGTNFKFAMYGMLIANIIVPSVGPVVYRIGIFLVIQVAFAGVIGLLESFRARKKLIKNPQFIVTLSSIALVAFLLSLLLMNRLIF
jgi:formate hydrogenlyase subunit 4